MTLNFSRPPNVAHLQTAGPEPADWALLSAKVAVEARRTATLAPGGITDGAAWTPVLAASAEVARTAGELTTVPMETGTALALASLIITVGSVGTVARFVALWPPKA